MMNWCDGLHVEIFLYVDGIESPKRNLILCGLCYFGNRIARPTESFKGLAIAGGYDHNDFCALCWCACFLIILDF